MSLLHLASLIQEYQQDVARYEAFLRQERREEVARKKNKSKLRYSDRMRLMGKPPLEGLQLEVKGAIAHF